MVKKKKEFDIGKELGIVVKWLTIISIIAGVLLKMWGIPTDYVLFLTIIFVLLIVIYTQYKKIKILEGEK